MKELERTCGVLYSSINIPVCICDDTGDILFHYPKMDNLQLPQSFINYCLLDFALQKRDKTHPLVLFLEPSYFIGIAELKESKYLLLGPAVPYQLSKGKIAELQRNEAFGEPLSSLCHLLGTAQVLSYQRFISSLAIAVQVCGGGEINTGDIILCNNRNDSIDKEFTNGVFRMQEQFAFHTPRSYEQALLEGVASGNVDRITQAINEPVTGRIGPMSTDPMRAEKYGFAAIATLLVRAAAKGGMDFDMACSFSDAYCQKMDLLEDVQEINALMLKMVVDFCVQVAHSKKKKGYSPKTRQCCDYIASRLHEDISLTDVASAIGLSTRHLSKKFLSETGMSIVEYIHREKMNEAKALLRHSSHSISDISNYLQYSSQSYFTKKFKSIYGITPRQCREAAE
ncbi:AraC family transcriptional regulator [Christensenellaceae bacterium OttesenSCG-928-K19]|nr:AraC family transcriptional regulator [Christensenellaceae bacterium OttesenSCG-928-K19]